MNLKSKLTVAAVVIAAMTYVFSTAYAQQKAHKVTVRGLVRDIACPLQNKQSSSRHFNKECADACARAGAPLGILTDDGTIYVAISDAMPDIDQRSKLLPFASKYVQVSGEVYERGGVHAIMIDSIHEDPSVKLNTEQKEQ